MSTVYVITRTLVEDYNDLGTEMEGEIVGIYKDEDKANAVLLRYEGLLLIEDEPVDVAAYNETAETVQHLDIYKLREYEVIE